MKTKIIVNAYPTYVTVETQGNTGGVYFTLTRRAAQDLADKLNKALTGHSALAAGRQS